MKKFLTMMLLATVSATLVPLSAQAQTSMPRTQTLPPNMQQAPAPPGSQQQRDLPLTELDRMKREIAKLQSQVTQLQKKLSGVERCRWTEMTQTTGTANSPRVPIFVCGSTAEENSRGDTRSPNSGEPWIK